MKIWWDGPKIKKEFSKLFSHLISVKPAPQQRAVMEGPGST